MHCQNGFWKGKKEITFILQHIYENELSLLEELHVDFLCIIRNNDS